MNATTITTASFTLKTPTGASVASVVSYNAATKTATINPNVDLASLQTYTVTLTTAVKSSTGTPLAAAYIWKFQTVAPNVAATYPNNPGGFFMSAMADPPTRRVVQQISPWSPIEVEFTEPMDPATITTASILVTDSLGAPVLGTITYDDLSNTAVFDPTGLLDYGETYTVNVLPTIAAVDGALLETGVTWQFTSTTIGSAVGIDSGSRVVDRHWTAADDTLFLPDRPRFASETLSLRRDVTKVVTGTAEPNLYNDERVGPWAYTVPVPEGDYDIRLYFAETTFALAGKRVFDVDVAETTGVDIPRLDIVAAAGGANKALVKTITNVTATPTSGLRGTITIRSTTITGQPQISGFSIIPRAPRVTATTPANGATGVSKTAPITATFSTLIAPTSLVPANVHLAGPNGIDLPITGAWAPLTKTATITPTGGLAPNTKYTLTLDATIKARTGLRLGAPYTWTFTTGP
jgi:Big-like domain-containing protein/malectin (di-glucose binding ER protein)